MKLGFIGLGKLGMPCAEVFAEHGYEVHGYDVESRTSDLINITSFEEVCKSNIVFVAVPTPHHSAYGGELPTSHLPPKDFNYTAVLDVVYDANRYMNKDQTLVLISTVLPGTVRRLFRDLIKPKLVYNPYLIAMGTVKQDMIQPEMIIIGTEDGSPVPELEQLYKSICLAPQGELRIESGTWEDAEGIKIFYNTFISAKIGIVNTIQDVAMHLPDMDAGRVCKALADSDYRIMGPAYMKPGMGDGGACHPRDNIALRYLSEQFGLGYDMFGAIMQAREQQAKNLANFIMQHALDEVWIYGKAYKPGVPYTDGSYSLLVASYLTVPVQYLDPLCGHDELPTKPTVVLLAHPNPTQAIPDGSTVIDPWRTYQNDRCNVIYYGNLSG